MRSTRLSEPDVVDDEVSLDLDVLEVDVPGDGDARGQLGAVEGDEEGQVRGAEVHVHEHGHAEVHLHRLRAEDVALRCKCFNDSFVLNAPRLNATLITGTEFQKRSGL